MSVQQRPVSFCDYSRLPGWIVPVEESSQSVSPDQAADSTICIDLDHPISRILFPAKVAVLGSISIPTYLRLRRFATIPTVPEPKNGSRTISSFLVPAFMHRSTNASGKTVYLIGDLSTVGSSHTVFRDNCHWRCKNVQMWRSNFVHPTT